MSESGGEILEHDLEVAVKKSLDETKVNRRQFAIGVGTFAAFGLGKLRRAINGRAENTPIIQGKSSQEPDTTAVVTSSPSPQPIPQSEPHDVSIVESKVPEQMREPKSENTDISPEEKLIDETALHLTAIYGPSMEAKFYPTEESKLEFFKALTKLGLDLNPDNPNLGNQLAAILAWESGFSPVSISNNGSKGVGLIQFTGPVPENLGTSPEELETKSPTDQLVYVKDYLISQQSAFGGDFSSLSKTYPLIINPSKIDAKPDEVLFPQGSDEAYRNRVLDRNGDGIITVGEAIEVVRDNAVNNYGENPDFL